MATGNRGGGGEDQLKQLAELSKTLKEGERILAPTRRPDGTLRKAIRVRAGYVPQDEVAIYQSKGTLWKKETASQVGPPGYDPTTETRPRTKSSKKNERKKEKRQQAALEKAKNLENEADEDVTQLVEDSMNTSDYVISLTSEMNQLAVSANPSMVSSCIDSATGSDQMDPSQDMEKRIRALKKKIRLAEAQQQKTSQDEMKPEQLEKLTKIEGWRKELKLLEDQKADMTNS